MKAKIRALAALSCLIGIGGFVAPTQATVVGSTLNVGLLGSPYTLSIANGQASYTFSGMDTGFGSPQGPIFVSTGGSGLVSSLGAPFYNPAAPTSYNSGALIDGSLLGPFLAYSTPAPISYSSTDAFVGLSFALADGVHYGYAEVYGYGVSNGSLSFSPTLLSFGYESNPGVGILTGAAATAVPEPSSLGILGLGLGIIGLAWIRRRAPRGSAGQAM